MGIHSGPMSQIGIYVPSFTFSATAYAFLAMGCNVILVDVDPETHLMSYDSLKKNFHKAKDRFSIVVPVNLWGQEISPEIEALSIKYSSATIFDAAHAFGTIKNQSTSVYSFHATKIFNTFEGGCIATHNRELAERLRKIRNFGFSNIDTIDIPGINGKMSEIHAAMGLVNLDELPAFQKHAQAIRNVYHRCIVSAKILETENNYAVIEVDRRDELLYKLSTNGITARRYFYPGIDQLPGFNHRVWDVPNTRKICERVLCLPVTQDMTTSDAEMISEIVNEHCN
jgi:dTDP-4-amino-4,6-dideoxygalactose transaminase